MIHYVISLFETTDIVNEAIDALRQANVSDASMTLLASANAADVKDIVGVEPDNAALEGALVGTGIGGALGALGSIALVAIPGVGAAILASGLIATLSGGVLGGYLGSLYGMRADTHHIIDMKNTISPDSIVLIVQTDSDEQAKSYSELLENQGSEWIEIVVDNSDE